MNFKTIFDKIHIYSGVIEDPSLASHAVNSLNSTSFQGMIYRNWRDWYTFGRMCDAMGDALPGSRFYRDPMQRYSDRDQELLDAELYLYISLRTATETCINHYVNYYSISIPEPNYITLPNLSLYHPDIDTDGDGHTMNFHTDYNIGEWWWPGEKYLLTCTTYLNDNYDGGEIVFYVDGELIPYKPKAGDILVFPSGDPLFPGNRPYYHGVRKTTNGNKILVRTYLKYWEPKNALFWFSNKRRYGEDQWKQLTQGNAKGKNMLSWREIVDHQQNPGKQLFSELVRNLYNGRGV